MEKLTKWHVRPAKTQINLGLCPVWSESSLSAWRKLGSLATYWAHSKDSDQTGWMRRLIWVFAGRTVILFLSWGSSNNHQTTTLFISLVLIQEFGSRSVDVSEAREMIKSYLNDVGREISDRVYFTEEEVPYISEKLGHQKKMAVWLFKNVSCFVLPHNNVSIGNWHDC